MDDHTIKGIMEHASKSQQAYAKAMELLCIISGGTIGIIVAIRANGNSSGMDIKIAIILLFFTILGVIIWFIGRAKLYMMMANAIIDNPSSEIKASEPWWGKIARYVAFLFFIGAYYFLLQDL